MKKMVGLASLVALGSMSVNAEIIKCLSKFPKDSKFGVNTIREVKLNRNVRPMMLKLIGQGPQNKPYEHLMQLKPNDLESFVRFSNDRVSRAQSYMDGISGWPARHLSAFANGPQYNFNANLHMKTPAQRNYQLRFGRSFKYITGFHSLLELDFESKFGKPQHAKINMFCWWSAR